uniref:Uncharacterized protein n=1 Tax=Romanomermis culicivorax TaxID=13658 RepID=A0A915K413_ROMCU
MLKHVHFVKMNFDSKVKTREHPKSNVDLSKFADSLSRNQIDEYESMLNGIDNRQNQLRSKQSCTMARVIPNKDLQAQRRFLTKRKTSIAKKLHLKKPMVENKKIIYAQWNSCRAKKLLNKCSQPF